jgi:predicted Zn-dependent protease
VAILDAVIRAHPDSGPALNEAGYLLADGKRRLDVAERYLSLARIALPGEPAVLDSWGWYLVRARRTREAIRVLDHAARFAPLEPEILYHLASAWAADGSPNTARAVLDRAAALSPSPSVARRIDQLRHTLPPVR